MGFLPKAKEAFPGLVIDQGPPTFDINTERPIKKLKVLPTATTRKSTSSTFVDELTLDLENDEAAFEDDDTSPRRTPSRGIGNRQLRCRLLSRRVAKQEESGDDEKTKTENGIS